MPTDPTTRTGGRPGAGRAAQAGPPTIASTPSSASTTTSTSTRTPTSACREDAVNDIIAERAALLGSAITLQVDDAADNGDGTQTADVVVANNLLGHSFPTGFAFARQFWLEVSATDSDGNEVCLVNLFAGEGVASPCSSGAVADRGDLVPQCDPQSVADTLGRRPVRRCPTANIKFAEPLPVGECDPWLANFQKILTDGDPNETGTFTEVRLPVVPARHRQDPRADGRRAEDGRAAVGAAEQRHARAAGLAGASRTRSTRRSSPPATRSPSRRRCASATCRPSSSAQLAAEQEGLTNITDSARIDDPQALIDNLVITDVVTRARPATARCWPARARRTRPGATILSCVQDVSGVGAVNLERRCRRAGRRSDGPFVDPWATAVIVGAFAVAGALVRRPPTAVAAPPAVPATI